MTPSQLDLANLDRPALETALEERGHQRFRARQIFRWLYRRGVTDFAAMTDLSRDVRATLASDFSLTTPELVARERSVDGTESSCSAWRTGVRSNRCSFPSPSMTRISTQVGCAMACAFCLTGKMGLVRN